MCAIFGITGNDEAANLTYLGLHAQQHRGQEGAGIVSIDKRDPSDPKIHRKRGLVTEAFANGVLSKLTGTGAIGHTRYSTSGGDTDANLQPLLMRGSLGWVSISHNGNLTNARNITSSMELKGSIFQTTSDTEVILHLMAKSQEKSLYSALVAALKQVEGAYSLLAMNHQDLIAARDPYGFRPLVVGDLNGSPVFASETCAFDLIGAQYLREVEPGEVVVVPHESKVSEIKSYRPFGHITPSRRCVFEYIYFARPDSTLYGENVYEIRKAFGRALASEKPAIGADVVVPIPDSGVPAAIGFSEASGIAFDMGIIRSHYIGRTFIEPRQSIRDFGVKLKLNPVKNCVIGKSVVVVDDSIVRGTTSKKLIRHLRDAGAKEIHMRISAPPTTNPCYYGIDTPSRKELLAASYSVDEMCKFIGADSLGYLSLEGALKVAKTNSQNGFCDACFSGNYPTRLTDPLK